MHPLGNAQAPSVAIAGALRYLLQSGKFTVVDINVHAQPPDD